jgi:hypothetical protein
MEVFVVMRNSLVQVFDSAQGGIEFARRELGTELRRPRHAQSTWIGAMPEGEPVTMIKRTVFKR